MPRARGLSGHRAQILAPACETLGRDYLWQSRWYDLRQDRVRTPAGHEFAYTLIEHSGAVRIVPVTGDGQIVLIRHYRYPVVA
jgi:ADP-ribose diphosphatase